MGVGKQESFAQKFILALVAVVIPGIFAVVVALVNRPAALSLTATPTQTETGTPVPTNTEQPSATSTHVPPTPTLTPSEIASSTSLPSLTPSETFTSIPPTDTATPKPSDTPAATQTPSSTNTESSIVTQISSPTFTGTPTSSAQTSPTPSACTAQVRAFGRETFLRIAYMSPGSDIYTSPVTAGSLVEVRSVTKRGSQNWYEIIYTSNDQPARGFVTADAFQMLPQNCP